MLARSGFELLRTPHTRTGQGENYGYGLFVSESVSPNLVYHGGSTVGFLADWTIVPGERFGVFVVTNSEWVDPSELSTIALNHYMTLSFGDSENTGTLSDYVGTYIDPNVLGTLTVAIEGSKLVATIGGQKQVMEHWYGDTYAVFSPAQGEEIQITFWRDPGQHAEYAVSLWGVAHRTP